MKIQFKILFLMCVFSLFITSCDRDDMNDAPQTATAKTTKQQLFKAIKVAVGKSKKTPSTSNNNHAAKRIASYDCFAYIFPITITNESVATVINSDDELADYYDSVEIGSAPEINFPITIKLEDGTEKAIANYDELDSEYDICLGEEEPCYKLNFPLNLTHIDSASNSSDAVVNSETELHVFLDEAFEKDENAYITFKYPVELTLSSGDVVSIENDDEFDEIDSQCYNYDDYDDYDEFDCFELQFPVKAKNNGEEITLNSNDDLDDYMDSLEDYSYPDFVFPISIIYSDNTEDTLNSLEELEDAFDDCFYEDDGDNICFDITYPFNLVKNDETTGTTINNDEEFDAYLDASSEDDVIIMPYPLTVIFEDGSKELISSDEEFIDLVDSCE